MIWAVKLHRCQGHVRETERLGVPLNTSDVRSAPSHSDEWILFWKVHKSLSNLRSVSYTENTVKVKNWTTKGHKSAQCSGIYMCEESSVMKLLNYVNLKEDNDKICIFERLVCLPSCVVSSEREAGLGTEQETAASSGLSKPLLLSIWLDCKNISLLFNQWKLNYPDSWGTLACINIFWQHWLRFFFFLHHHQTTGQPLPTAPQCL